MNHRLWMTTAAVAVAISLLGCKKSVDGKKMESVISDSLKTRGIALKSVTCPASIEAKAGGTFDCQAETPDGVKVVFHVTQTDDQGNVTSKTDGALINTKTVGDSLEPKLGKGSDVKCPDKLVVLKKGDKVTCDLTFEGQPSQVDLVATNDNGDVDYTIHGDASGADKAAPDHKADDDSKKPEAEGEK